MQGMLSAGAGCRGSLRDRKSRELLAGHRVRADPGRVQRSRLSDREPPVVDRGCNAFRSGLYPYQLQWTPDGVTPEPGGFPSLLTAVQDQLGLRLDAQKVKVEVLVIDQVKRPTLN